MLLRANTLFNFVRIADYKIFFGKTKPCKEILPRNDESILAWEEIQEIFSSSIVLPYEIDIHVIRHAESEINAKNLITGSKDAKLTSKGRHQASSLGERLEKSYDFAFTSTLVRATSTLDLAVKAGNISVDHVVQDPRLNERSLGILEGKKQRVVQEYASGNLDYAPQNGETYREVSQRILSFLISLTNYVSESKNAKKILICSHMGPMRILAGILEKEEDPVEVLKFHFSNADVWKIKCKELHYPKFLS